MTDLDIPAIRAAHMTGIIGTHWDGCHLSHTRCAIARLCDEVEELRSLNDARINDLGDLAIARDKAIVEMVNEIRKRNEAEAGRQRAEEALREAVALMGELETRYCDLVPMSFPPPMTKPQHEAWLAWCQRRDNFLAKHGGKP